MPCRVIVFATIILLGVCCLAQGTHPTGQQEGDVNSENQAPFFRSRVASRQIGEQSISVIRLSVPRKARELYEKSIKLFRTYNYGEAQQKLDQALHLYAAFPEALTMRGCIHIYLNRWDLAEQSLQSAVRSDPTYGWAYLMLSNLYNRERRFDDALLMSQRAVALIPDAWPVRYEMARALIGNRRYVPALDIIEAALRDNRGTLLHVAKAHALIGLARYPEAAAELQTYLHYQPVGEGSQDAHDLLDKIQSAVGR